MKTWVVEEKTGWITTACLIVTAIWSQAGTDGVEDFAILTMDQVIGTF